MFCLLLNEVDLPTTKSQLFGISMSDDGWFVQKANAVMELTTNKNWWEMWHSILVFWAMYR
jgi:hypothetical protein